MSWCRHLSLLLDLYLALPNPPPSSQTGLQPDHRTAPSVRAVRRFLWDPSLCLSGLLGRFCSAAEATRSTLYAPRHEGAAAALFAGLFSRPSHHSRCSWPRPASSLWTSSKPIDPFLPTCIFIYAPFTARTKSVVALPFPNCYPARNASTSPHSES